MKNATLNFLFLFSQSLFCIMTQPVKYKKKIWKIWIQKKMKNPAVFVYSPLIYLFQQSTKKSGKIAILGKGGGLGCQTVNKGILPKQWKGVGGWCGIGLCPIIDSLVTPQSPLPPSPNGQFFTFLLMVAMDRSNKKGTKNAEWRSLKFWFFWCFFKFGFINFFGI